AEPSLHLPCCGFKRSDKPTRWSISGLTVIQFVNEREPQTLLEPPELAERVTPERPVDLDRDEGISRLEQPLADRIERRRVWLRRRRTDPRSAVTCFIGFGAHEDRPTPSAFLQSGKPLYSLARSITAPVDRCTVPSVTSEYSQLPDGSRR